MPNKRAAVKRHSAFEEFPVESGAAQSAPESLFPQNRPGSDQASILSQPSPPSVERIERLHPSQMIPDRFQPRRLLPGMLRHAFFSGQIDCYQAARQWLQLGARNPAVQAEIDRLLAMGGSFEEHGQIKPITGAWTENALGEYVFQIETGERRFWAACLRRIKNNDKDEPNLRVEVVPKPTRTRQVLENRHAEPPSAVGQACEVASLILDALGETPDPQIEDEFEYFRGANRRKPAGLWEKITPVMQLTRPRMEQLLDILNLPTPLLEQADRHRIPERVLREVIAAPQDQWESVLNTSIQNSLTSDDVAALTNKPRPAPKVDKHQPAIKDPATTALQAMIRFSAAMNQLDELTQQAVLDELSDEFVINGQSEALAGQLSELARLMLHKQNSRYRRR